MNDFVQDYNICMAPVHTLPVFKHIMGPVAQVLYFRDSTEFKIQF